MPLSTLRIVCIGDAHDAPALPDKRRFRHIGRYIREKKPDVVVQVGDFLTLDSLSTHRITHKPTFAQDLASFDAALAALDLKGPALHCTLGNHENRAFRATASRQCHAPALIDIFKRHGWKTSPYGQPVIYGGVGFAHAALNRLGLPYGGKCPEQSIADDAVHDLVLGHSHVRLSHRAPKLGGNKFVQIINVGCALPGGYVADYARHCLTGWSYGIAEFVIRGGHVEDEHFISMTTLAEDYGRVPIWPRRSKSR